MGHPFGKRWMDAKLVGRKAQIADDTPPSVGTYLPRGGRPRLESLLFFLTGLGCFIWVWPYTSVSFATNKSQKFPLPWLWLFFFSVLIVNCAVSCRRFTIPASCEHKKSEVLSLCRNKARMLEALLLLHHHPHQLRLKWNSVRVTDTILFFLRQAHKIPLHFIMGQLFSEKSMLFSCR